MTIRHGALMLLTVVSLTACGGGTKLIRPSQVSAPAPQRVLAQADDGRLAARVDWVIVRNGAGAWARNADWDEYLLRLDNRSGQSVDITAIAVVDSLDTRMEAQSKRKALVRGSKATERRYRKSNLQVRAGMGGAGLVATGAAITVVGYGAAVGSMAGSMLGAGGAAAGGAAAASALLLAGPAFAVAGVVRAVRNSQVDNQVQVRAAALPLTIPGKDGRELHVFFPLAPSPRSVEIAYNDGSGAHVLTVDTSEALAGLHLGEGGR